MRVSMLVAVAGNGVIGNEGEIPWRLPEDQQFFRRTTIGHVLIYGRKTFDSIGRALSSAWLLMRWCHPVHSSPTRSM